MRSGGVLLSTLGVLTALLGGACGDSSASTDITAETDPTSQYEIALRTSDCAPRDLPAESDASPDALYLSIVGKAAPPPVERTDNYVWYWSLMPNPERASDAILGNDEPWWSVILTRESSSDPWMAATIEVCTDKQPPSP